MTAGTPRLSEATLAALPADVERPTYDRGGILSGIVHLGIGAFHRAHEAVYIDDILKDDPSWAIVGASLRSADTLDALKDQDGLYALSLRSGEGERLRIIGSVVEVLVAREERERLLAQMADPMTRIVSLTVTEKGYCHDPATGELDEANPDIRADLATPRAPSTAPGLIVEALARRRAAGAAPFTVLTCDNLPSNGHVMKRILDRFAALRDADLGAHVAGEVACPSTMVDRIVPATTEEDRARIDAALGVIDRWPVVAEPFIQWVIEDRFAAGRPAFEAVGAEMVSDVAPYEDMKLRLLNGAHSSLAYLGYLSGYATVSETMADAEFARFVKAHMDQASPTLRVPASADLAAYKAALVARFKNPALKHRTWQIAMDGSQKLPQRLLGTIGDCIDRGLPFGCLALGVAGWMRYVAGVDEKGGAIDVRDPLAARLRGIADEARPSAEKLARGLIGVEAIFGNRIAGNPVFVEAVTERLGRVLADGARSAVATEIAG